MEGLIPYVYRAILRYRGGGQAPTSAAGSWLMESPSFSYVRLAGDSGRFQLAATSTSSSDTTSQLLRLDQRVFSSSFSSAVAPPSPAPVSTSSQLMGSNTTTQSLLVRTTSRRLVS